MGKKYPREADSSLEGKGSLLAFIIASYCSLISFLV